MLVVGEKRCLSRGPTLAMAQCGGYRVLNVNGGSESAEARCVAVATPSGGSWRIGDIARPPADRPGRPSLICVESVVSVNVRDGIY